MKKGLLSLLAVALTVVSCQNYDDQFESLTDQITTLSGTVAGLTAITDQVTALQQLVNGLATADNLAALAGVVNTVSTGVDANADAIADNATNATNNAAAAAAATASATAAATAAGAAATAAGVDAAAAAAAAAANVSAVASVTAELAAIQTTINSIVASLTTVATAAELDAISDVLADVELDVQRLLEQGSSIEGDLVIKTAGDLAYAKTIISTGTDALPVIVKGSVDIDVVTPAFTVAQISEVNELLASVATVLTNLTLVNSTSTAVDFTILSSVNGTVAVTGSTNIADGDTSNDVLRTVGGTLTISGGAAGLDLSELNTSGAITIDGANLTSVNLGSVTAPSVSTTSLPAGHLSFPKAETVNTGGASVINLVAAKATDIDVKAGTASLTISAALAQTIDIVGTTLASLTISTVATPAIIHADAVTSITEANIGGAAQFHIGAVTTMGTSTIAAGVVDVSSLAAQTGALTFSAVTAFTAPLTTSSLTLTAAKVISLKSTTEANIAAPAATNLTITALDKVTSFTAGHGQFPALVSLNITGAAHATPLSQANDITVTSTALTGLTIAGTNNDVTISGTASLTTLNVSGFLNALVINNSDALVAATLDHDHLEGADASYLTVTNNLKLASVATPNLQEIGSITIADNAALASIALAAPTSYPVAGSYTISVTNNKLTGTYVNATAQSTTTAYVDTIVKSDDLLNIKTFIDAVTGSSTYTYHMEVDTVTVGSATLSMTAAIVADADSTTMSATIGSDIGINTAGELANVVAE